MCLHVQYDHQTYSDTILDVSKSEIVSLENIEMGEQTECPTQVTSMGLAGEGISDEGRWEC